MDTKTRILQAATELFELHGVHGASIRDICSKAEANIAAVNYYFGGKDALYTEVVRAVLSESEGLVPMPEAGDDRPLEQNLAIWIDWYVRRQFDPRIDRWMNFLRLEIADPTPMLKEISDTFIAPVYAEMRRLVTEILPGDPDPDLVTFHCNLINGPILKQLLLSPLNEVGGEASSEPIAIDKMAEWTLRTVMTSLKASGAEISDDWAFALS